MVWKSSIESGTPASRAMASRCSTALVEPPGRGDTGDRVLERLAGGDVARLAVILHHVENDFAAAEGDVVLARVHLRDGGRAHRREADQLHHRGHGVGGELAAAGSGAGAGVIFDFEQLLIGDAAAGVGADGFEDIHEW